MTVKALDIRPSKRAKVPSINIFGQDYTRDSGVNGFLNFCLDWVQGWRALCSAARIYRMTRKATSRAGLNFRADNLQKTGGAHTTIILLLA